MLVCMIDDKIYQHRRRQLFHMNRNRWIYMSSQDIIEPEPHRHTFFIYKEKAFENVQICQIVRQSKL